MLVSSGTLVTFRATGLGLLCLQMEPSRMCGNGRCEKSGGGENVRVDRHRGLRITATFAHADLGGIRYRHIPVHGIGGTLTVSGWKAETWLRRGCC